MKKKIGDLTWGLKLCRPQSNCAFCKHYGHDSDIILQFRNHYVTGLPADVVVYMVDPDCPVRLTDFHHHAYRHNWNHYRRRVKDIAVDPALAFVQVMRRLKMAHNVISDNTGDKMVQHLIEMAGITKKVEVQQKVTFTWEDTLAKADSQKEGDAVFTLEDGDFTDVTEAFAEEESGDNTPREGTGAPTSQLPSTDERS